MQRHFTATAFIVDSKNRTLLLWHKRLKRWLPPGGHIGENETPQEAAKRECKEETGLDVEILGSPQSDVFQGNCHEGQILKMPLSFLLEEIPACPERGEEAHQHMDFVYLARPVRENQPITLNQEEGEDIRWFSREEIEKLDEHTEIFANVKTYILSCLQASLLVSA